MLTMLYGQRLEMNDFAAPGSGKLAKLPGVPGLIGVIDVWIMTAVSLY